MVSSVHSSMKQFLSYIFDIIMCFMIIYIICTVDPDFVAIPKGTSVECPVCMGVFIDPYRTECCSNYLCFRCISRLDRCPLCRSKAKYTYSLNTILQDRIHGLHVYCTNKSRGCKWIGKLLTLRYVLRTVWKCIYWIRLCKYPWSSHMYTI